MLKERADKSRITFAGLYSLTCFAHYFKLLLRHINVVALIAFRNKWLFQSRCFFSSSFFRYVIITADAT